MRQPQTEETDKTDAKKNETLIVTSDTKECSCLEEKTEAEIDAEEERYMKIEFQNYLHNVVYTHRCVHASA